MNRERPSFLRVVGGTDHESRGEVENVGNNEIISDVEDDVSVRPHMLLNKFSDVVGKMPADFALSTNEELMLRYQELVKGYTLGQLYTYLSRSDLWEHTTFTRAVLEEVIYRKGIKDYSPRA